jgi:DNA-binding XRE family transcriptional regulator
MPTSQQFRAARALLGWSQMRLAKAIGVATITIKRLENSSLGASEETQQKARQAFEDAGIEFTGSAGVKLRKGRR